MLIPATCNPTLYCYRSDGRPNYAVGIRPRSALPGSRPDRIRSTGAKSSEAELQFASARIAAGYAVSIAFANLSDAVSFLTCLIDAQDAAWHAARQGRAS